jgi:integrase
LNNDPEGIRIALLRAQKIESDLNLDRFQWSDWTDALPDNALRVSEAIEEFTRWYWQTRKSTPAREKDFVNVYGRFFAFLPQAEALTGELLRSTLVNFEPDSYYRMRAYLAYGALARWAGIELPKDWKFLKGKYQPRRDRLILSDKDLENLRDSITNPAWQWVFGILAAYGLRPHEIFHLDLSRFPVLKVQEETKTGARLVYPLHGHWAEAWELDKVALPNIKIEGKTNKELGTKISQEFRDRKLGIVPYSLRDAYAIRGAKLGIDSLMMSKWMGHSVAVHSEHYLSYIDEAAMERIWQANGGGGLRLIKNPPQGEGREII